MLDRSHPGRGQPFAAVHIHIFIDSVRKRAIDPVILDLRLPGPDGLSICRALRRESRYVPILMLTSKSSELDRVLGMEANFAGTSFLTLEKLRKLRYGSEIVHVVADARIEHGPGLGTFGYDDEGVPAQCTDIIKDGLFVGYLTSRETAPTVGEKRSNGTMRSEGWNYTPLIRMTNVSLLPGHGTLEDLIADTDDGIYMETNRSWSIDDRRYHFQFGCELGWEIRKGKKIHMLKNPSYSGITTEFWNSCNAICGPESWTLWGTPNCGKGQPSQTMGTGHGASPSRFRNVTVGIAYAP